MDVSLLMTGVAFIAIDTPMGAPLVLSGCTRLVLTTPRAYTEKALHTMSDTDYFEQKKG